MKNKKISIFLLIAILLFPISSVAKADSVNYKVTEYNIVSNIQKNGIVDVVEEITYDFESKANGIYRDIDLKNQRGQNATIHDISVYEETKEGIVQYKEGKAKNGMGDIYTLDKTWEGVKIKVYSPADKEKKKYIIKYSLDGAIVKYNDTAELFWSFIGGRWDSTLENVKVNVSLAEDAKDNLKVFSHGPLYGESKIVDSKTVEYKIDKLGMRTPTEIRVLFPNSSVPECKNAVNKDMLNNILNDEAKRAEKANRKRKVSKVSGGLSIAWPILSAMIYIVLYKKYGKNKKYDLGETYITTAPGDYGPASASYITNFGIVGAGEITAEIMHMVNEGYLTMEEASDTKKYFGKEATKSDYIIKKNISMLMDRLMDNEKFLINWFIDKIGDGTEVSFKDIKDYSHKNSSKFSKDLEEWKKIIKADTEKLGFISEKTDAVKYGLIFFIISLCLGILAGAFEGMWGFTASAGLSSFFVFIFSFLIRDVSPKMVEARAKWNSYRNYLRDVTREKKEDTFTLPIWEGQLPYAIMFGYYNSAAKHIKKNFSGDDFYTSSLTYLHGSSGGDSFSGIDGLSSSIKTIMSDLSSSTGVGVGSSGTGGAGGGGGGGAF